MPDKQKEKLAKLCEHWANHNESHMESFVKWRDIANEMQLKSAVEDLNKAIESMKECNKHLLSVIDGIK
jgi:nickel/cobalt exporter